MRGIIRTLAFACLLGMASLAADARPYSPMTAYDTAFWLPVRAQPPDVVRVTVTLGNNQLPDHIEDGYQSRFAFDFAVGQSYFVVTAAQAGTVIAMNDASVDNRDVCKPPCPCWTKANFVVIQNDGDRGNTSTLYMHLQEGSVEAQVHLHEHVIAGQAIGLVGMTGCTTGPHLHFQRELTPIIPKANPTTGKLDYSTGWWKTESQPVTFSDPDVAQLTAKDPNWVTRGCSPSCPVIDLSVGPPAPTPTPTPIPPPIGGPGAGAGSCSSTPASLIGVGAIIAVVTRKRPRRRAAG